MKHRAVLGYGAQVHVAEDRSCGESRRARVLARPAQSFTEHHGEQIAREVGVELLETPIDLDGYRAAMGFTEETDAITFRDLQERRELIARRLEAHERPRRRVPLVKAVYRLVRPVRP